MAQHQSPSSLLVKKRSSDYYSDHNYRDAIGRLKCMLSDSYPPTKYSSTSSIFKSVTDDETDTTENTIVERPIIREVSKHYPYKPYSTFSTTSSYKPVIRTQNVQVPGKKKKNNLIHFFNWFLCSVGSFLSSDALIPVSSTQPPHELLSFIEKQESYIEQLEKESHFCRVSLKKQIVFIFALHFLFVIG